MSYCFYGGELEYVNMYRALSDTDTLPNIEENAKTSPAHAVMDTYPFRGEPHLYNFNAKFRPMTSLPSPPMPYEPDTWDWSTGAKPVPTYNQVYKSPADLYDQVNEVAWGSHSLFGLDVTRPNSPNQLAEPALLEGVSERLESPLELEVKQDELQSTAILHRKPPAKATLKKKTRRCRKQYGTIYDEFGNEIVDPVKRSRKRIAMLIEEDNLRRKYEEQERAKIAAARIQRAERRAKAHNELESSQQPDSSITC